MIKRPKGDGRCIHCREILVKETKDHVFPSSWYPDSTPSNVQRWTAPSCETCNGKFGEMEKELFVRLALCVDPRKTGAAGLSKRAVRSFGVDVTGISQEERRHREALRDKIRSEIKSFSSEDRAHVLPGLGPHPGFTQEQQFHIEIPAEMLFAVAKKIARGCEYWLNEGRIVEPPYEIDVFLPSEMPADVVSSLGPYGPEYLGAGCRMRRAGAVDDVRTAMHEIVIWESLTIAFVILPPDAIETSTVSAC